MKTFMFVLLALPLAAHAQKLGERVKENTKRQIENRIEQESQENVEAGMNKIEEKAKNGKNRKTNNKKREASEQQGPGNTNDTGPSEIQNSNDPGQSNTTNDQTDFSEFKNSDFIPGKTVIFFEDFTTARLGNEKGNWHLYEYDAYDEIERPSVKTIPAAEGNWLKMPRKGFVFPNDFKSLPEECTIEMEVYADPEKMSEHEGGLVISFVAREDREEYSIHWNSEPEIALGVHPHGPTEFINLYAKTEYHSDKTVEEITLFDQTFKKGWKPGKVNHVAVYRKDALTKLFVNGTEYIHLDQGLPKKLNYNFMLSTNLYGDGMYVTNVRVATNVQHATEEISTKNKFATSAIYFEVNSDHIKPESWAALNDAAKAIKAVKGNFQVVGHTDSDGAEDANLVLSEKRAAAVKAALVSEFGIDVLRLSIAGKGEADPVQSNITSSGKAANRRVEFIKLP